MSFDPRDPPAGRREFPSHVDQISPRARSSAVSAPPTEVASDAFAKPIQATSAFTSSGAASGAPRGSVTMTPASRAISSHDRS